MQWAISIALVILILPFNDLFARELAPDVRNSIRDELRKLDIAGCTIDLNVRIPVTVRDNPYCTEDCVLWGTLIQPRGFATTKNPTILVATGYRRELSLVMFLNIVRYGYNLLVVDVRGTGSTDGTWPAYDYVERYDLKHIIDRWIPSRPWSDGKVGMLGCSYMGIIQLLVAGIVDRNPATGEPEHLKAVVPLASGSDMFREMCFHEGNFHLAFTAFWVTSTTILSLLPPLLLTGEEGMRYTDAVRDSMRMLISHVWNSPFYFYTMFFNSEFVTGMQHYYERSPIIYWPVKPAGGWAFAEGTNVIPPRLPMLMTVGWFDIFTPGACNNYSYGLSAHQAGDKALIIGEWYHFSAAFSLGLPSMMKMDVPARWFDWKIKGKKDRFLSEFPVLLRVMGVDRWRAEKGWPLPPGRVEHRALYLSGRTAARIKGDWFSNHRRALRYSLVFDPEEVEYGGKDPVMRHSGNPLGLRGARSRSSNRWLGGILSLLPETLQALGAGDRLRDSLYCEDDRPDELGVPTFTTTALEEDLEITGPLLLTFWARTSYGHPARRFMLDAFLRTVGFFTGASRNPLVRSACTRDVQWVAELHDVYPGGRARNVASGWLLASWRQHDPAELPGEVEHRLDPQYVPFDPFYRYTHPAHRAIREGDLYEYAVELWPTCNVFRKGHRIRLSISGSDYPHLLPVLYPSYNTIVIDERRPAKLSFTAVNDRDEGRSWKWIDDPDDYLRHARDDP